MYSGPVWRSCPSPTRIPRPPAAKNCLACPEASFTANATPTVSSERPHLVPVTDSPSEDRRIDVGELKGFKGSLGPTRLGEDSKPFRELLFQIETHAPAVVRRAHGGDVRWHAGLAGDGRRVCVPPHPPVREKSQQLELAGL